jgi:hypothetical protein
LKASLEEEPSDPGAEACRELLIELDKLIGPLPWRRDSDKRTSTQSFLGSPHLEDVLETVAEQIQQHSPPENQSKLRKLRIDFLRDQLLIPHIGKLQLSNKDIELWHEVNLSLLHVPEDVVEGWQRNALTIAKEAGLFEQTSSQSLLKLPFVGEKLLYSGLTGFAEPSGVLLSPKAPLDERVAQKDLSGDLYFLASLISIYLTFVEIAPSLFHHALKSVYRFGIVSLNSAEERSKYMTALIDRFQRAYIAEKTSSDPRIILGARIDLDEAIHSLLFLPPASQDSWWGRLQRDARRTLEKFSRKFSETGMSQIRLRPLLGTYADVCTLSKDDIELDNWGEPGEVAVCLRVYARVGQEEIPGRVLFRSLR